MSEPTDSLSIFQDAFNNLSQQKVSGHIELAEMMPSRPVFAPNDQSARIAELEAENAQLKSLSATPASDTDPKPMDPSWPNDPVHRAVKDVIDGLSGGKVRPPAREALGKALDAANKPLTGKAASDGAVGRAIRLESASGWEAVRR